MLAPAQPQVFLDGKVTLWCGDALDTLRRLPANHFDCCVTSPPYWGLRDYGVDGQLGLERSLGEHLAVMVEVFREVRRVLKPTGTLWLNYGDCYATSPNGRSAADTKAAGNDDRTFRDKPFSTVGGVLKAKDLAMLPSRLAIALQEPYHIGPIKSEIDRAWLAGLIDADGSIGIRREDNGHWNPSYIPYITVGCSDIPLVQRCADITGLGRVNLKSRAGDTDARGIRQRRDGYVWRLDGQVASRVIRDIYPYLVQKRAQAQICHAMNVSQGEHRPARNKPVPADIVTYRQQLYESIKALNQRRTIDLPRLPAVEPNIEQGWWVRSEIIWHKPNPMPESIKDRPACSHEKVFLLSKSERYFYDHIAVRQPLASASIQRLSQDVDSQEGSDRANGGAKTNGRMKAVRFGGNKGQGDHGSAARRASGNEWNPADGSANLKNVWTIPTASFSDAHFATFPPALAERCIKAGCPVGGHVLDVFGGAGTTGLVAASLGRTATLIELNPEYCTLARARIEAAFMGKEEGARHMVSALGKTQTPESLPLFGGAS